ncbi:BamA/TamA family outer membrane protein [Pedobacter sp. SD-b]|uniref:BamA/TamA family outer membrane protein n=1 Tax=Pedobacter segetis TaxID=2793069 RepID=A0ABS1BKC3_9SPHI|nr:BamA/TamA family outer membrane protein [Pedobacter segetis]MBK0383332.1 BamA/TamA family outer membrane protein [Pedobacter segetis]
MKKFFYSIIISISPFCASAQNKIIEKLFSNDTTRHNSFLPVPLIGFSQEAGFQFGAAGIYSFYTDYKDKETKASQIYGVAAFSTKKQLQLSFKTDAWAPKNNYHYLIETKYYDQTFNFYGTGNNTRLADEDLLNLKRLRLNAEIEKKVIPKLYLGGGVEYENLVYADKEIGGIYTTNPNYVDKNGGQFLFFKGTFFYDTRDNVSYSSSGIYFKTQFGFSPDFFGAPNFEGSIITADVRNFHKISDKINLGLNATFESLSSSHPIPFYVLRQLGNDQFMRGYYTGRYRDENLITSQAEIRYRPVPRFGLVAFGGAGKVYSKGNFSDNSFKPTYGIGGRIFFDLEKGLALRFDYALGEKPIGEKRISGFYISLGEAF